MKFKAEIEFWFDGMDECSCFYSTGEPLYLLGKSTLPVSILNKAKYLTTCSFVESSS